jgi:hypothetical protein
MEQSAGKGKNALDSRAIYIIFTPVPWQNIPRFCDEFRVGAGTILLVRTAAETRIFLF